MNSYENIKQVLTEVIEKEDVTVTFLLSQPEDVSHGDYATNIAFILGKVRKTSPQECAKNLIPQLKEKLSEIVEKIEIAGPGFINFFLKDEVRTKEVKELLNISPEKPLLSFLNNQTIVCEYTDPNPFKLFHIGHLVPNTIGEALSRIYEQVGAKVERFCYQGDVGMHVATTIWGIENMKEPNPSAEDTLRNKVAYLGRGYVYGTQALKDNPPIKEEIININKHIFEGKEHKLYEDGKKWSLGYFQNIYDKLGTVFDYFIFESEVWQAGKKLVKENTPKVFEESEGAIVYKGEKVGLHTRVFINKEGIPTYEAKELGNCLRKEELVPGHNLSVVISGNEISEYFKVIKSALGEIYPEYAKKLLHISHGMLRLPEGKMSSRTGDVIPAEDLIDEVKSRLSERLEKSESTDKEQLANDIAVGAIKFSILRQAPGKDIVFEIDKSISFEGDSGPYLQYTHARLCTLLEKAKSLGISDSSEIILNPEKELEQVLLGYSKTLEKSYKDLGPHHIIQYLIMLTRSFNGMYGRTQIVDGNDKEKSAYYVMLSKATKNILAHGLHTLGIKAPERM